MIALLVNVTSLLELSYGKKVGLRAGLRAGGRKSQIYYPIFFSIAEKRLEEWTLGYQQVIHNAIMPTAVIVQVVVEPACEKKEALELYKYL